MNALHFKITIPESRLSAYLSQYSTPKGRNAELIRLAETQLASQENMPINQLSYQYTSGIQKQNYQSAEATLSSNDVVGTSETDGNFAQNDADLTKSSAVDFGDELFLQTPDFEEN